MKRVLIAGAAMLLLTACVSTNATVLGQSTVSAPINPAAVVIYRTAAQVPATYREVALLNSRGDYAMTNERKMFESMKTEAAKLGANGIILDAVTEPSPGIKVAAAIFGVSADRKGKAIAINVEGGATAATAPAPVKVKAGRKAN
jgi:hypothetical protein